MKRAWVFVWRATGLLVAIDWCIYSGMFIGAWAGWNEAPAPALSTQAVVFLAAAMFMLEGAFPALTQARADR